MNSIVYLYIMILRTHNNKYIYIMEHNQITLCTHVYMCTCVCIYVYIVILI